MSNPDEVTIVPPNVSASPQRSGSLQAQGTATPPPKGKWGPKPGVFTFYKLTSKNPQDEHPNYTITKFSKDLDVESSYTMNFLPTANGGYYDCSCPGAAKVFKCRHKDIMAQIRESNEVNGERFFCFETKTFKAMEEI